MMEKLYTAEQTRSLDQGAIQAHGIPGIVLMARAADAVFRQLMQRWPEPGCIHVFCGTGNNGGDGFLVADLARKRGLAVRVYQLGEATKIGGDALSARDQALGSGVEIVPFEAAGLVAAELSTADVIVDAMLGTGLGGPVREEYNAAIAAINAAGVPVVAVDIPSGLCADSGQVLGAAVRAQVTVTFIGLKRGLFCTAAPDYVGEIEFSDLGVPASVYDAVAESCTRLELNEMLASLPARPANAHKGMYGTVLVIGGDYGMAGAAGLAAEGALRCGAGLVRVATRPEHVAALVGRTPEVMVSGVASAAELEPLLASADVLVLGPGLGQSDWSVDLLQRALLAEQQAVIDADALNLLASGGVDLQSRENWILTPHPGEAARLLGISTGEIQADRFAAAAALVARWGGVSVLKGNGTLVAGHEQTLLSDYGNPGMASGGMGDVLSGVVAALWAQGLPAVQAAALAVCLHGAAADRAAPDGRRGLLATDLMPHLRALLG